MEFSPIKNGQTVGLVGPVDKEKCGIAIYLRRLHQAMKNFAPVKLLSYQQALEQPISCSVWLVHYERSLIRERDLKKLCRLPGKTFLVPHEVYQTDPMAFPFSNLSAKYFWLLRLKQWKYKLTHRRFEKEIQLQKRGYWADRIIPLSRENSKILSNRCPGKCLPPLPLAFPTKNVFPESGFPGIHKKNGFLIVGVPGFTGKAVDYAGLLRTIRPLSFVKVIFLGGSRQTDQTSAEELKNLINTWEMNHRAQMTGFLKEIEFSNKGLACDCFVFPFRFKSNTASVREVLWMNKPVFLPDAVWSRELEQDQMPVSIFRDWLGLEKYLIQLKEGTFTRPPNRCPWNFNNVALEYLKRMNCLQGK